MSEAQGNISKWKEQALSLKNIPTDDVVLQETLGVLEGLSHQVEVMAKLLRTTLGEKHWKAILQGQKLYPLLCHLHTIGTSAYGV